MILMTYNTFRQEKTYGIVTLSKTNPFGVFIEMINSQTSSPFKASPALRYDRVIYGFSGASVGYIKSFLAFFRLKVNGN